MNSIQLWLLLRKRTQADRSASARFTSVLAVIAFAATSAVSLVVVGGLLAFIRRWQAGLAVGDTTPLVYVMLAGFAVLLLLVPLATLGAAAARLAMARRDARLAALRLAGATTGQVSTITLLDAGLQAATGSLIGVLGYLAVLPLVTTLSFQGRQLGLAELWVGFPLLGATVLGVAAVGLVSAASSLQRVVITPLGVAARTTRPKLSIGRLVFLVAAAAGAFLSINLMGSLVGLFVLLVFGGFVALAMAVLNLIGPLVLQIVGRITASRARTAATLLAGRRIADDPKAAWRSVGGVAIATFIAGLTSLIGLFGGLNSVNEEERVLVVDLTTGGLLTLVIAGVLAAVSTGVMQAGRLIDQRQEYRNLVLAGTDTKTLDRARLRETSIPLLAALGTATVSMLVVMVPVVGTSAFVVPEVVVLFVGSVLGTAALVMSGAWATGFVARGLTADLVGRT
ncbi:hypothetical protein [Propionicimonas sp.]|uniref:hypothetical protein n=1 Tax=Propionicimonas sp. TaxID=1955623 RepID=UPI001833A1BF|nr:hypothetical protein [Propionicimonas sp.]MBU3975732.1 hypothetical protein [Actinomycetota bacterium]MBA3019865.1 hypothetical protein [Propionicimonas sp.]MBU3986119.1 hypothetical protein [Actinomycetota bacterium]MBU4007448.1 hypothetical protein [Actinomycetota bacterium]MBU4063946.1 hypothetical protein [Actinomycetota bacterium]